MWAHIAPLGRAEAWLGPAERSGKQLRAHTPPVISMRAGRWSDRAGESGTPWCSSPLLSPPQAQNKMAFNLWDNPTSPHLTQPQQNNHPWCTFTLQNKWSVVAPLEKELTDNREFNVSLWALDVFEFDEYSSRVRGHLSFCTAKVYSLLFSSRNFQRPSQHRPSNIKIKMHMQDSTIGFTSSLYGFTTAFLPEKGRHWPLINGQDKGILGLENDEMANRLHQKNLKKLKY